MALLLWVPVLYFQSRPAAKPQAYTAHTLFANSARRPNKHRYSPDSSLSPSVETLLELLRPTLWASFLSPAFFLSYFWSIFLNPCNIFWLHLQNTPRIRSVSALSSCPLLVRIAACQVLAGTVAVAFSRVCSCPCLFQSPFNTAARMVMLTIKPVTLTHF